MTVRRAALALLAYIALAALLTRPLLELSATHIAGDPYDPLLNATVLIWNATVLPLTAEWWNAPLFFPAQGVTTFTENLLGLSPIATPLFWLTGNPLTTYNVTLFASWPLSAFAAFLLARHLTGRGDAAFAAGLVYGFSPYRVSELGHLQMTASYYLPLILLGLHGYLDTRRRAWLLLFGAAWILQSLANAYLMLFGAVMIGAWLAYFGTTRSTWRAIPAIAVTGVISTLPLLAIMLRYRTVHADHGLLRSIPDPTTISFPIDVWYQVSRYVALWRHLLPDASDNHFPGLTGLLILAAGGAIAVAVKTRQPTMQPRAARRWRWTAAAVVVAGVSAAVALYAHGPFSGEFRGLQWRMTEANRPLWIAAIAGGWFVFATPWLRDAIARRSRLLFYTAAMVGAAWLACGAVLMHGSNVVLNPAPYQYLLAVPGFSEVRVPARFWMIGVLALAIAAGLALVHVQTRWPRRRGLLTALVVAGALADGWTRMPMATAPSLMQNVEPAFRTEPFVELPIGPGFDNAPSYRAVRIGRRTFNGASGHDPIHYLPLVEGLRAYDAGTLQAMATFGAFDVVIDLTAEAGDAYLDYVSNFPGATTVSRSATRALLTIPGLPPPQPGAPWPIAAVRANEGQEQRMIDGDVSTDWSNGPQHPGQWVLADLGQVRDVSGVTQALGAYARDYPRHLIVETSVDGLEWSAAWEGSGAGEAFRAAVLAPLECRTAIAFSARPARYVRLRQTATHVKLWRIFELTVHAPK